MELDSSSATLVSAWRDQSGHGRDATQTNINKQPNLVHDGGLPGTRALSLPWLQFHSNEDDTGADDGANLDVDLSFLAESDYTIVAISSRSDGKRESYLIGTGDTLPGGPGNNNALHVGFLDSMTFMFSQFGNDLDVPVPSNTASWQPMLSTCVMSGAAGRQIALNGTVVAIDSYMTRLESADEGAIGRGYLSGGTDNDYFEGGIGEVIVYDIALGDEDRRDVEMYLQSKWMIAN